MSRIYVEEQNIFYNVTPKITLIVDMLQLIENFLNMLVICYAFIVNGSETYRNLNKVQLLQTDHLRIFITI